MGDKTMGATMKGDKMKGDETRWQNDGKQGCKTIGRQDQWETRFPKLQGSHCWLMRRGSLSKTTVRWRAAGCAAKPLLVDSHVRIPFHVCWVFHNGFVGSKGSPGSTVRWVPTFWQVPLVRRGARAPRFPWARQVLQFPGRWCGFLAAVKCCTRPRPRDWNPMAWLLGICFFPPIVWGLQGCDWIRSKNTTKSRKWSAFFAGTMTEPVPCNFEKALDLGTFTMKPCRNLGLKTFLGNLYLETLEAMEISPGPLPGETFTWLGTLEILRTLGALLESFGGNLYCKSLWEPCGNSYNVGNLGNLENLGSQIAWEPVPCNFGNLVGTIPRGFLLGTFTWKLVRQKPWKPSLGNLGTTYTWKPSLGNLHLWPLWEAVSFTWGPLLGNLH